MKILMKKNEVFQFHPESFSEGLGMSTTSKNMILDGFWLPEIFKKLEKVIKSKIEEENDQI